MRDYSKLCKMLERELDVVEDRERFDMNTLEITDKVIHSLKNICKIKDYQEHHAEEHKEPEVEDSKSWDELSKEEKDLRWYSKMMSEAKTEEERALITKLMNMRND